MSGYIGNPDAESEHALHLAENGLDAVRSLLKKGAVLTHCLECEEEIAAARREFFIKRGQACSYCVECQPVAKLPSIRMLDRIL